MEVSTTQLLTTTKKPVLLLQYVYLRKCNGGITPLTSHLCTIESPSSQDINLEVNVLQEQLAFLMSQTSVGFFPAPVSTVK